MRTPYVFDPQGQMNDANHHIDTIYFPANSLSMMCNARNVEIQSD
jgi:hypothetical protein